MLLVLPSITIDVGAMAALVEKRPNAMSSCSGSKRSLALEKDIVPGASPSLTRTIDHAPMLLPASCVNARDHLIPVIVHGKVAVIKEVFDCVVVKLVDTLTIDLSTGRLVLFSTTKAAEVRRRFPVVCIFL